MDRQSGAGVRWLVLVGIALAFISFSATADPSDHCPKAGPIILVDTSKHQMRLCENGAPLKQFYVALGSGVTGKKKQGDNKTPLGTYALGVPRKSVKFGTFIPIGYPTPVQAKQGYSGGDVGIHGPDRNFRWLGS